MTTGDEVDISTREISGDIKNAAPAKQDAGGFRITIWPIQLRFRINKGVMPNIRNINEREALLIKGGVKFSKIFKNGSFYKMKNRSFYYMHYTVGC